jgi:hypothetical protein
VRQRLGGTQDDNNNNSNHCNTRLVRSVLDDDENGDRGHQRHDVIDPHRLLILRNCNNNSMGKGGKGDPNFDSNNNFIALIP